MKNHLLRFFIFLFGLMVLGTGIVFGIIAVAFIRPDLLAWAIVGGATVYSILLFLVIRHLQKIFSGNDSHTKKLLETGVRAAAAILNIEGTAWRRNYNPVVRLSLRVKPPDRPAFDAKIETTFIAYKPLHIGDSIEVVFNPGNPLEIVVVNTPQTPLNNL